MTFIKFPLTREEKNNDHGLKVVILLIAAFAIFEIILTVFKNEAN